MIEEPFAHHKSAIHCIDPRIRIVSAVLIAGSVAVSYEYRTLLAALLIAVCTAIMARLNPWQVILKFRVVMGFLLLLWILLPLVVSGPVIFLAGPIAVKHTGAILAGQITLKSISIILFFIALITTMPFAMLGQALGRLGLPPKLTHLLLLTYRYIFVMQQEYKRLLQAARVRGFKAGTNLHTYKTLAYFAGMLLVNASLRAERVYNAMRLRGFNGVYHGLKEYSLSQTDAIWCMVTSLIITGLWTLEYGLW